MAMCISCKREPQTTAPAPYRPEHALSIALTLAALRGNPDTHPDRKLVERYRVETMFSIMLMRRWTVADKPSDETITPDEIRNLLGMKPPAIGEGIELGARTPHLPVIIAAFLDPAARIAERTKALTGVGATDLQAQLRERLKIDLANKTINGAPWTTGRDAQSSWIAKVVDHVSDISREISLADAKLLDPGAELGKDLWFRADIPIWVDESPRQEPVADHLTFESEELIAIRHLAKPQPPVAGITTPVFAMYPEGHGVLYTTIPRTSSMAMWKALDADKGLRPILFYAGDTDLLGSRLTWRSQEPAILQAASHPMDSPAAVLAAADTVDVPALLAKNPSYTDHKAEHGPWPTKQHPPRLDLAVTLPGDDEGDGPTATRILILIPADAAWKTIAYMPGFVTAGEATPSLAQVAAVSRRWEEKYGARLAAIGPATLEWYLSRKLTKAEALALAAELEIFSPDADEGTVEEVAAVLMNNTGVTAWWD
jgi:hypothetical protein